MRLITLCALYLLLSYSPCEPAALVSNEVYARLENDSEALVVVLLDQPGVTIRERSRYLAAIADTQDSVLKGLSPADYTVTHRFQSVPAITLRIRSRATLDSLSLRTGIRQIGLDTGGRAGLTESLPLVRADIAHSAGFDGSGMTVAVLDTGIDSDHPDLADALVAEQCFCYNPAGGRCPNGQDTQSGPGSAEDDHGHGTHVTGIITGNGTVAPMGIAPEAKIVAVKVLDSDASFYGASDIVAALDWIAVNRPDVDVVNMSIFTYVKFTGVCDNDYAWTQALAAAVNNLRSMGILCVGIAGNSFLVGELPAPG